MSREDVAEVEELDAVDEADVQDTEGEVTEDAPKAKEKKGPARGDLPEGFVTPIGLAKELTERGLHTNRDGEKAEVRPQMVYSYMRNAPKDDPFPITKVTDSIGGERQALRLEEGIAWWERKNERVAARKANAAEKEAKKKLNAEKKAAEASEGAEDASEGAEPELVEAE